MQGFGAASIGGVNFANNTVIDGNNVYPRLKGSKIGHIYKYYESSKTCSGVKNFCMRYKLRFVKYTLNEIRLDDSINNEVKILGFNIVGKDGNRNGGVVAIYLQGTIPYVVRDD